MPGVLKISLGPSFWKFRRSWFVLKVSFGLLNFSLIFLISLTAMSSNNTVNVIFLPFWIISTPCPFSSPRKRILYTLQLKFCGHFWYLFSRCLHSMSVAVEKFIWQIFSVQFYFYLFDYTSSNLSHKCSVCKQFLANKISQVLLHFMG